MTGNDERGRVLLFTGKGGVGKTTLAAATAAHLAARGRKVLVVSTDPAHSLADALATRLTAEPSEVDSDPAVSGLYAAQVDPRALLDQTWHRLRAHLGTLLAGAGVAELAAEELTALPGVEELLALTEVHRLLEAGPWEQVVVDCGPTAETLRLLALPEAFAGYLERLFPTHRRVVRGLLAGLAGSSSVRQWDDTADALGRLADHLAGLRAWLTDPAATRVRLVCTPERVVVAETRRTLTALALHGIHVDGLIANRVVPDFPDGVGGGPAQDWLRARRAEQDAVLADLRAATVLDVRVVEHLAGEPVGVPALVALAGRVHPDADSLAGPAPAPEPPRVTSGVDAAGEPEYLLHLTLPLVEDDGLDLARVDDDLVLTVAGGRRRVTLPSVLRRCVVTGAELDQTGLVVRFRPDPALWMG